MGTQSAPISSHVLITQLDYYDATWDGKIKTVVGSPATPAALYDAISLILK
jgi:hypothetical protein